MEPFTDADRRLFVEGRHSGLHRVLGAHRDEGGTTFRVWAPSARAVQVVGEFDDWGAGGYHLARALNEADVGVWTGFVPGARPGQLYKYRLTSAAGEVLPDRADPLAAATEEPPATASMIADLAYEWGDEEWLATRGESQALTAPISIYELHVGSWRGETSYRALAEPLADYVLGLGFTHVELLPVMEHPFDGSWGYQTTGYYAPTSRFGSPQDLMYFIDALHQRGLGVILDWTPAHFANDPHGLGEFDGSSLYEHPDPRRHTHPEWGTLIFNYDRPEVRSFLISSACSWLERYHADGLRIDAVSSMLFRDFLRDGEEWVPNERGGREDYAAAQLLRDLNDVVSERFPGALMCAEEVVGWPKVTHPTAEGGLGFTLKWDLGWSHDTLAYLQRSPSARRRRHHRLTFRGEYASTEHFLLPLSHDDAADGKGSMLAKLPGTEEQRLATLRALLGYQYAMAGKKLVFMGTELASAIEWNHVEPLDWTLAEDPARAALGRWLAALNRHYGELAALHEGDCAPEGFEWVSGDDTENTTLAFLRRGGGSQVLVMANFSARAHEGYRFGVPEAGPWSIFLDSDAVEFGGTGATNVPTIEAQAIPWQGRAHSIALRLPPLAVIFLRPGRAP